jgi:signal transduction histidine kinase
MVVYDPVTLRILAAGRGDPTAARVEVAERGIGVDGAAMARMFEPFTQADVSRSRSSARSATTRS